MTLQTVKLKWAQRLLRAKYFVVLTDKGSVIGLDGTNPSSLEDSVAIAAQHTALLKFRDSLDEVIKEHADVLNKGAKRASSRNTPKVTKINVKKAH